MTYFERTLLPIGKTVLAAGAVVAVAHTLYSLTPGYAAKTEAERAEIRTTATNLERLAALALLPVLLVSAHFASSRWGGS